MTLDEDRAGLFSESGHPRLTPDAIWLLWRRVTRALPMWTMPWESFSRPAR